MISRNIGRLAIQIALVALTLPFAAAQTIPTINLRSYRNLNTDDGTTLGAGTMGINVQNTTNNLEGFWWDTTANAPTTQFATALAGSSGTGLQPQTVRYPSGTHANYWDWKAGTMLLGTTGTYLTPPVNCGLAPVASDGGGQAVGSGYGVLTLDRFKKAYLDTGTDVQVIWVINMLTYSTTSGSTLRSGAAWSTDPVRYQAEMLETAMDMGIGVKYIELGNEFYADGSSMDDSNAFDSLSTNPRGYNYGNVCKYWINNLISILTADGYSTTGLQFGLINFTRTGGSQPSWNLDVRHGIESSVANNIVSGWTSYGPITNYDVIFHLYFTGGFGTNYINPSSTGVFPSIPVDFSNYGGVDYRPQILAQPFIELGSRKAYVAIKTGGVMGPFNPVPDAINNMITTYTNPGQQAWITEYNLLDKNVPIHGTWLQGMFDALQGLMTLEVSQTRFLENFTAMGDAIFSEIYSNSVGPEGNAMNFQGGITSSAGAAVFLRPYDVPPATTAYGFSPTGQTHRLILDATRGMLHSQQINFPGDPDGSNGTASNYVTYQKGHNTTYQVPVLYGYRFTNATTTPSVVSAIVLNLSGTAQTVDMSAAFGSTPNFRVREWMGPQQHYQPSVPYPDYYPGVYLYGSVSSGTSTPVELDGAVNRTGATTSPSSVTFPPYSITELYGTQ